MEEIDIKICLEEKKKRLKEQQKKYHKAKKVT